MAAGIYNFKIEQGATTDFELVYKDSDGNPIDLSGYSARMDLRQQAGASTSYLTLSSSLDSVGLMAKNVELCRLGYEVMKDKKKLNKKYNVKNLNFIIPSNFGSENIEPDVELAFNSAKTLPLDGTLDLLKGVYNRIAKDYLEEPLSFTLQTYVDAPPGSGLGSSSTLVVAIISSYMQRT